MIGSGSLIGIFSVILASLILGIMLRIKEALSLQNKIISTIAGSKFDRCLVTRLAKVEKSFSNTADPAGVASCDNATLAKNG